MEGKAGDKGYGQIRDTLACNVNELDFILQVMGSHLRDVRRKGALSKLSFRKIIPACSVRDELMEPDSRGRGTRWRHSRNSILAAQGPEPGQSDYDMINTRDQTVMHFQSPQGSGAHHFQSLHTGLTLRIQS